jgi:hypothetical protein
MNETKATLRLYYLPQSFPCGPESACCGPVGQSEEELRGYAMHLREALPGVELEAIDMSGKTNLGRDLAAIKLLNTFGAAACPIVTVNGEVVSMGPPSISELIELAGTKLNGADLGKGPRS